MYNLVQREDKVHLCVRSFQYSTPVGNVPEEVVILFFALQFFLLKIFLKGRTKM